MAGLAAALRWLVRLEARAWTTDEAASLAHCDQLGARAYLRRLAGQRAVVEVEPDRWRPGPKAAEWARASRAAKTREGGGGAAYRAAKALREAMAAEDWRLKRAGGGDLTPPRTDQDRQPPTGDDNDMPTATESAEMISYSTAADRMGVSVRSLERIVARGELPVVRYSPGLARIPAAEVAALIRRRTTRGGKAVHP